jgi:hypothetical protein
MNIERKISMMGGMGDAFLDEMSSIVFDQGLDSPASALLDDLTPIPVRISEPDLQQHCHRRHSDCAVQPCTSPTTVSASSSVVNNEPLVPVTTQKKVPGKTPSSKVRKECSNQTVPKRMKFTQTMTHLHIILV